VWFLIIFLGSCIQVQCGLSNSWILLHSFVMYDGGNVLKDRGLNERMIPEWIWRGWVVWCYTFLCSLSAVLNFWILLLDVRYNLCIYICTVQELQKVVVKWIEINQDILFQLKILTSFPQTHIHLDPCIYNICGWSKVNSLLLCVQECHHCLCLWRSKDVSTLSTHFITIYKGRSEIIWTGVAFAASNKL
jgi:hypothetical protein